MSTQEVACAVMLNTESQASLSIHTCVHAASVKNQQELSLQLGSDSR